MRKPDALVAQRVRLFPVPVQTNDLARHRVHRDDIRQRDILTRSRQVVIDMRLIKHMRLGVVCTHV